MNAADFELNLLLSAEARLAETLRGLAAHAARYAGSGDAEAERYGAVVEQIAAVCLGRAGIGAIPVIFRRNAGPMECLIGCERRFDAGATGNGRITIDWTQERGAAMCRIALAV